MLTWQHSRQFADAETLYRATIASNPASWMARNNLASLLLANPSTGAVEAVALLRDSVRLEHDNPVGHYNLGLALQFLGRHAEAIEAFRTALAQSEAMRPAPGAAGQAAVPLRMYGGNPRRLAQVQRYLGRSLAALGRGDAAVAAFRQSLEHAPEAAAHADLALALVQERRLDEALIEFRRAQQLEPSVGAHVANAGAVLLQQGRIENAAVELARALRLDPALIDARLNLAAALDRLGRLDDAAAEYRRMIDADPAMRSARARLIGVLERGGRIDDAIAESRRAIAAGLDSADLRNDLGLLLIRRGDPRAAALEFAQALRLDPAHAPARSNLLMVRR